VTKEEVEKEKTKYNGHNGAHHYKGTFDSA
jgi:hypothetical protein